MPSLRTLLSTSTLLPLLALPGVASEGDSSFVWYRKAGSDAPQKQQDIDVAIEAPDLQKFFGLYCIECHGPDFDEGDFRVDELPNRVSNEFELQRWQDVYDVLNSGYMPPKRETQPTQQHLLYALENLHSFMGESVDHLAIGENQKLRRLNRREYQNTIHDLLGVMVPMADIPEDNAVGDFDTNAEALTLSPSQLLSYLEIGRSTLDKSLPENFKEWEAFFTPPDSVVLQGEDMRQQDLRRNKNAIRNMQAKYRKVQARLDAGATFEDLSKEKGTGDARSFSRQHRVLGRKAFNNGWIHYDKIPNSKTTAPLVPVGNGLDELNLKKFRESPPGHYIMKVRASRIHRSGAAPELVLSRAKGVQGRAEVTHQGSGYGEYTFRIYLDPEDTRDITLSCELPLSNAQTSGLLSKLSQGKAMGIYVDEVELVGPYFDSQSQQTLKSVFENTNPFKLTDEQARLAIRKFASIAFRRQPVSVNYINELMELYQKELTRLRGKRKQASTLEAMKLPMSVILASPSFIYLSENYSSNWISDRDLAVRLSYFLWGGPPDAELWKLVYNETLHIPGVLVQSIDRMISHYRFERFINGFTNQWLELDRMDILEIDRKKYPNYDGFTKESAKREPQEFVKFVFQNDLPLTDLIDSDYAIINPPLARFYGLPEPEGSGFQQVRLPFDSVRGGLLTQSAVLTLNSNGDRPSAVDRGAYILRKFLDWRHLEPPPNVPQLAIDGGNKIHTVREALSLHASMPQCMTCHQHIDPLGYGLENFDTVGKWRNSEKIVSPTDLSQMVEAPIDSMGSMPGGKRRFNGVEGLKTELMKDRDLLVRSLAKSMYSYSLGRASNPTDGQVIDHIVQYVVSRNYSARALIHAVVASRNFQSH
ncbi:MAG: DUF1592 domain-containing protein [Opitutales bacterium]